MRFSGTHNSAFETLARLIYQAECLLCKRNLGLNERDLCIDCTASLQREAYPQRERLKTPYCPYLASSAALFPYRGKTQSLLKQTKFWGKEWLMDHFSGSLKDWLEGFQAEYNYDVFVPVPMSTLKRARRGFNQAEILAKLAARLTGTPYKRMLRKRKFTITQSRLKRKDRLTNLEGAYKVRSFMDPRGKKILLIDDVMTTGATLSEAAKTLKRAGAKEISSLSLAFTEKSEL